MSSRWTAVEIDPAVFDRLRSGAPAAKWVRLLLQVHKQQGATQLVYGALMQTILFDSEIGCTYLPEVTLAAKDRALNSMYFQKDFAFDGWTKVLVGCDVDGRNWAQVHTDPAGPREVDYVSGDTDDVWRHLEEHREELDALGRAAYG